MKSRSVLLVAVLGFAVLLLSTENAQAIPAFARLYRTECNTCHTIFPDRRPFGDAFRKNSYTWPGAPPEQMQPQFQYTPYGKAAFQGMSSSRQLQESRWLVAIPDLVPISFWVNHDIVFNKGARRTSTDVDGNTFDAPASQIDLDGGTELEMFTAGSFRGKAGWWAEYNFAPDHDIGEIYLQIRHLIGSPVNLKVGRFIPKLSLWKSNDSATISSYGYNEMVVGVNPLVTPSTTGNPFMIDREQGGGEVNGVFWNRLFGAFGVTTPPEKTRNGVDLYGHLSFRLGGMDFNGNEPQISLSRESIWDNLALTFGTFCYFGTSLNEKLDPATNKELKFPNDFWRAGGETEILYKNLRFRLNGILGGDKNPQGPNGRGSSENSLWLMAQGQYIFRQNILAAFRYERQDIEHEGITHRYIPTLVYAPWQNVRAALEYDYEILPHYIKPTHINRIATCRLTFAY